MTEKQTNLLEFELKMAQVPLADWTESNIRSWLTLRERAQEDRRVAIPYVAPSEPEMELKKSA